MSVSVKITKKATIVLLQHLGGNEIAISFSPKDAKTDPYQNSTFIAELETLVNALAENKNLNLSEPPIRLERAKDQIHTATEGSAYLGFHMLSNAPELTMQVIEELMVNTNHKKPVRSAANSTDWAQKYSMEHAEANVKSTSRPLGIRLT